MHTSNVGTLAGSRLSFKGRLFCKCPCRSSFMLHRSLGRKPVRMQAAESPDTESEQPGTSGRVQQAPSSQELPGGRPKGLKVHFSACHTIDRKSIYEACVVEQHCSQHRAKLAILHRSAEVSPDGENSLREWSAWERKHGRALQPLTGVRMVSQVQGK